MTIDAWLEWARSDAERRGMPELVKLLEGLAQATRALRNADVTSQEEVPSASDTAERRGADDDPR